MSALATVAYKRYEVSKENNDMAEILREEGKRPPEIGRQIEQDVGWKKPRYSNNYLEPKYKLESFGGTSRVSERPLERRYSLADAKNELGEQ